jgi:hypothetical protein
MVPSRVLNRALLLAQIFTSNPLTKLTLSTCVRWIVLKEMVRRHNTRMILTHYMVNKGVFFEVRLREKTFVEISAKFREIYESRRWAEKHNFDWKF